MVLVSFLQLRFYKLKKKIKVYVMQYFEFYNIFHDKLYVLRVASKSYLN